MAYNEVAKRLFEQDARRYLRRVAQHLGWPSATTSRTGVTYNAGGIAVSGECRLRLRVNAAVSVMVEINAGGCSPFGAARSPSGAAIMWRFEPDDPHCRLRPPFHNRFPAWHLSAQTLAQLIRGATIGRSELTPLPADAGKGAA